MSRSLNAFAYAPQGVGSVGSRELRDGRLPVRSTGVFMVAVDMDARLGYLYSFRIRERLRRRGHGRLMLGAAKEAARKLGCTALVLSVAAANPEAVAFYRACGARRVRNPEPELYPGAVGFRLSLT